MLCQIELDPDSFHKTHRHVLVITAAEIKEFCKCWAHHSQREANRRRSASCWVWTGTTTAWTWSSGTPRLQLHCTSGAELRWNTQTPQRKLPKQKWKNKWLAGTLIDTKCNFLLTEISGGFLLVHSGKEEPTFHLFHIIYFLSTRSCCPFSSPVSHAHKQQQSATCEPYMKSERTLLATCLLNISFLLFPVHI